MTEQEKIDQFNRDVEGVLKGNAPEAGTDSQRLDAARQLAAADFSANSHARATTRARLLARANRELPVQNKRKEMNTKFSNVFRTLAFGAFLLMIVFGLGWVLSNTTPQVGVEVEGTPTLDVLTEEPEYVLEVENNLQHPVLLQLKNLAERWDASLLETKPIWIHIVQQGYLTQFPSLIPDTEPFPLPNPRLIESWYFVESELQISKAITFQKDTDGNVVLTRVKVDGKWFNLTLGTSEPALPVTYSSGGLSFLSRAGYFLENGGTLDVREVLTEGGVSQLVFAASYENQVYEATFDPNTGQLFGINIYQLGEGDEKTLTSTETDVEESWAEPPADVLALLDQVSTPQPPAPLTLESDSETIRQRILLSHTFWQALWADAQITDYVSGTPAVQRVQVWVNQPAQARVLSGKADGTPATLWISDGQLTRTGEDLSGYGLENFVPPMTESDTVYPHPMTGIMPTPLSSLLFPSGLAQRGGTYRPIAIETVAGRETLVVEWNRPDGPLTDRFWVDTVTGVILHQQNYGKGGDGALTYEYLITHFQYDLTFPSETFNRLASFPPVFASGPEDIFTEVATPVSEGEPDTSLASGEIYLRLEKSYMTEPLGFWRFPASCLVSGLPCPPLEAVPGTPQDSPIQYTWSPDYTQLIYKMEDAGVRNWRFDRLTQTWTLLDIPDLWAEIWSPDSQWLLGVPPGQPENYPLMLTRTDGTEWQTFMDGSSEIKNPIAWLDDHRILMTTTLDNETSEESPTLAKDLQIYDLQTGEIQTLLSKVWNPDTTFYGAFALSPDRTKVVYSIADLNGQNSEIRILTLADNTEFSFTFPAPAGPHWSPTGEWLSLTTAEGYSCGIHLIRPDGSDPHLVFTGDQSGACQHIWSPDGQYILVPAQPQISTIPRFYVINVATGESRLVELPDVGVEFEWPVVSWVP